MTFGETIRTLRRDKGLTQRRLAEKVQNKGLRCDFTYLSKIENNYLDMPPSEDLIRCLAEILDSDPEQLLSIAGQFDRQELQGIVSEIPEAGTLLRKLQNRQVPRQKIQKWLEDLDE